MSKAFVKEPDSETDLSYEPPAIPVGTKNYMTPQGHRHMQDELHQLLRVERPKVVETVTWAAGNGNRSENGDSIYGKHRLREIDRRIRFLSTRLESAEVVDPKQQKKLDQVFFGATVTYADGRGEEKTITIVGIDEADLSRGQVSWVSPVARALMKAQEGDIVDLRAPSGVEQIEVLEIRYGKRPRRDRVDRLLATDGRELVLTRPKPSSAYCCRNSNWNCPPNRPRESQPRRCRRPRCSADLQGSVPTNSNI